MSRERNFDKFYIVITIGILLGAFCFYSRGQIITWTQMIFLCLLEVAACFCSLKVMKNQNNKNSKIRIMTIIAAFLGSHCYGFIRGIGTGGAPIEHTVLMGLLGACVIYFVVGIIVYNIWLVIKNNQQGNDYCVIK